MKTTSEYIDILRRYKEAKTAEYGIISIGIFGSVARGTHSENSDIDICVTLEKPSIFRMVHIKEELQELTGVNVDIVRLRYNMDSVLKRDIKRDCIYV